MAQVIPLIAGCYKTGVERQILPEGFHGVSTRPFGKIGEL
jgi:hypothetical protein